MQTKKDVPTFLGMTGYYRRFIQNYAKVAAPLSNLASSPAINFATKRTNKQKLRPGIHCMGNCAHALAMKTRGLATDCRYKTCCAQCCYSYATDGCSNVVDARYLVFEGDSVNDCIQTCQHRVAIHSRGCANTSLLVLEH